MAVMRFLQPWAWAGLIFVAGLLWMMRHQWTQQLGLDRAAFVVRALALVLLVVALTAPQSVSREPLRYIYFLVDRSASSSLAQSDAEVLNMLDQFDQENDQSKYGLIVFGKQAFIDQPFSDFLPESIETSVDPSESNLAEALSLALETLPSAVRDQANNNVDIILFSDGQVEEQRLLGVLERARRSGVRVWVRPVDAQAMGDVRLDEVQLPREVTPDRRFEGTVYVHAESPGEGNLLVYRDDELLEALPITLDSGSNVVRFTDELTNPGRYRYQVRYVGDGDVLLENNVAADLVTVSGSASLLVYDRTDTSGQGLSRLLDAAAFTHERKVFNGQTLNLSDLSSYKGVVLNNISIANLDVQSINTLKAYVSELGGGLWVIEGQQALENVNETEFEDMLPVTFEGPQREQLPGVAIIFVLDRSSSMAQSAILGATNLTKLDVLKEAAAQSIEVLREEDSIGIVTFDSSHNWLVPVQQLGNEENRQNIYGQVQRVFSGGGTDLLPPLVEAFDQLQNVPARVKHILVFSDGKTVRQDRDFASLFARMQESDITVSSIGLGQQPDEEMLQRLADSGQGEFFLVRNVAELPKISVRETRRIVQRRWVVGDFPIEIGPFAQLRLSGLDLSTMPNASGYVRTYPKPLSQTAISAEGSPLLTFWQYGLGQVAVLNSDLEGIWTNKWGQWNDLSEFAAEVVSQLYANPISNAGLVLNSELHGSTLKLELDALDGARWVNELEIEGSLIAEESLSDEANTEGQKITFSQVAPGRYVAEVNEVEQGLNLINLQAKNSEALANQQTHVVAVPYPMEYQNLGNNSAILSNIASTTGGRVLEDEQLDLGPLREGGQLQYQDLWPLGMILALSLFMGDLLLRKIPLEAIFSKEK
jgi:Mg-chelatase subunit ChlD